MAKKKSGKKPAASKKSLLSWFESMGITREDLTGPAYETNREAIADLLWERMGGRGEKPSLEILGAAADKLRDQAVRDPGASVAAKAVGAATKDRAALGAAIGAEREARAAAGKTPLFTPENKAALFNRPTVTTPPPKGIFGKLLDDAKGGAAKIIEPLRGRKYGAAAKAALKNPVVGPWLAATAAETGFRTVSGLMDRTKTVNEYMGDVRASVRTPDQLIADLEQQALIQNYIQTLGLEAGAIGNAGLMSAQMAPPPMARGDVMFGGAPTQGPPGERQAPSGPMLPDEYEAY